LETVERDYSPKGVKFFYIYKALAHPENNGYITPFTLEERLMHVAEAKRKLDSRITWLCDTMSNDLKHALGDAPNSEFVVDPDGKIVRARQWSRPQQLREDLAELVGKVDKPTAIADLKMKRLDPPKTAATGVVPRVKLPGRMMPLKVQPISDFADEPFYVKLRAEVEPQYFQNGSGKLYLGFFLDPLYEVHWNNRAMPVQYEIEMPDGLTITPSSGKGPTVEEDADADPREFLLDVSGKTEQQIKVTVKYIACDAAETFCKPITQYYQIALERDRDGGARRAGGRGGPLAGRFGAGAVGPGGGPRPGGFGSFAGPPSRSHKTDAAGAERSATLRHAVALFKKYDTNEDGKLDKQEWAKMDKPPAKADADANARISLQELIDWLNQSVRSEGS